MNVVLYVFNKFREPNPDEVLWRHVFSVAYGSQIHVTRLMLASHILVVYTLIGMWFTNDNMIVVYGQLVLACMLMVELKIFTDAVNAIDDFKKL